MPIKREYTPVKALGKLAQLAGEAEAAKRAEAFAQQRLMAQLQAEQQRERLEFQARLSLEAEQRAQLWELEKMEIRSRNTFALQEKKWLQKEEEKQAKMKKLEEAKQQGYITDNEYKRAWFEVEMGVKLPTPKKEDKREELEEDYSYYLNILRGFKENVDITPGIWKRKTIAPLAVVDKKGEVVREATAEEKVLYDYAKTRLEQLAPAFSGAAEPEKTAAPTLTKDDEKRLAALSEIDKANFRRILEEGNPEKIKIALNRLRAR